MPLAKRYAPRMITASAAIATVSDDYDIVVIDGARAGVGTAAWCARRRRIVRQRLRDVTTAQRSIAVTMRDYCVTMICAV